MRLSTYAIGVPAVVVAVVVAVANRRTVVFSLDPFSQTSPALALRLPLFLLVFVILGLGVLLGGERSRKGRYSNSYDEVTHSSSCFP